MAGDINLRLNLDPSGFIQGLHGAAGEVQNFYQNNGIANPSNSPSMVNSSNGGSVLTAGNSANNDFLAREKSENLVNAIYELITTLKQANDPNNPRNPPAHRPNPDDKNLKTTANIVGQLTNLTASLITGITNYDTAQTRKRIRALEADPFGMLKEDVNGTAGALKTGVSGLSTAAGIAVGAFFSPMAGMITQQIVSAIGSSLVEAWSGHKIADIEETETKSNLYKNRLPVMEGALLRYGNGNYSRENMFTIQGALRGYATDTGVSLDEFMGNATSLSRYGITDSQIAGSLTRAASLAARNTGADTSSILNYLGTQQRYAGGNGRANMNYAYSAALETGLTKDQFGEFLDGLESVIESGISKGYVSSSKDVADTMVMFSKMSGNDPLWTGELGFQMYNKMQSGMSAATNLSNTSQMLMYQAMRGLTGNGKNAELETLKMMEGDLTVDKFKAINGIADRFYANDYFSKVSFYKNSFGLNWTQADKLASMDPSKLTDSKLKEVIADSKNETDSTKMYNQLNSITESVSKISEAPFDEYLTLLSGIAKANGVDVAKLEITKAKENKEFAYYAQNYNETDTEILAKIANNPNDPLHNSLMQILEEGKISTPAQDKYNAYLRRGVPANSYEEYNAMKQAADKEKVETERIKADTLAKIYELLKNYNIVETK